MCPRIGHIVFDIQYFLVHMYRKTKGIKIKITANKWDMEDPLLHGCR